MSAWKRYAETGNTHARLEDEFRSGVRERLQSTRKAAFSAPKVGKDAALNMLVYRDALDRISKTRDQRTFRRCSAGRR